MAYAEAELAEFVRDEFLDAQSSVLDSARTAAICSKAYRGRPLQKYYEAKHRATDHWRAKHRAHCAKYRASKGGRAKRNTYFANYRKSARGKAKRAAWELANREKRLAQMKAWRAAKTGPH